MSNEDENEDYQLLNGDLDNNKDNISVYEGISPEESKIID